jgi:hypothetical protein
MKFGGNPMGRILQKRRRFRRSSRWSCSSKELPCINDVICSMQEEDTLYDAEMDEKDAQWADKARDGRVSDAILSW